MRTASRAICLLLMAMTLDSEAATGPISQAWAVRIDSPASPSLLVSGMDVAPSGDVFLVGPFGFGGYRRDLLITRRSSNGALVWERIYAPPEGPSADESAIGIVAQ